MNSLDELLLNRATVKITTTDMIGIVLTLLNWLRVHNKRSVKFHAPLVVSANNSTYIQKSKSPGYGGRTGSAIASSIGTTPLPVSNGFKSTRVPLKEALLDALSIVKTTF